jgi:hypothetical protein
MPPKGTNIPDGDRIMRHVPWSKLRRDDNDNVVGFLPQAFERRVEEDALSVSWVDHHPSRATAIDDAVREIRQIRKVGKTSAFAVALAGKVREICAAAGHSGIRIVHEPLDDWPSHAGIRRIPRDDLVLLEALATEAFTQMLPNQSVRP